MLTTMKNWILAFVIAIPVVDSLSTRTVQLGQWLPEQPWFADLLLYAF